VGKDAAPEHQRVHGGAHDEREPGRGEQGGTQVAGVGGIGQGPEQPHRGNAIDGGDQPQPSVPELGGGVGEGHEGQQAKRQQWDQRPHDRGQPHERVADLSWRNHVVPLGHRERVGSITRGLLGPSHRHASLVAPANGQPPLLAVSCIACQQDRRPRIVATSKLSREPSSPAC
jgi:hypothetical protein